MPKISHVTHLPCFLVFLDVAEASDVLHPRCVGEFELLLCCLCLRFVPSPPSRHRYANAQAIEVEESLHLGLKGREEKVNVPAHLRHQRALHERTRVSVSYSSNSRGITLSATQS